MNRRYTDEERATALAALVADGGNVKLTAAKLGIPRMTLASWANGDRHPEATQMCHEKKGELADAFEGIAWRLLDAMPAKIAEAPLQAVATAAGICVDKMLLLRGEPTVIADNMTDEERDAQIRKLGAELGYWDPKPN
jgi:transposase-like protein